MIRADIQSLRDRSERRALSLLDRVEPAVRNLAQIEQILHELKAIRLRKFILIA